jgi:serine/threonine protein kinase
MPIARQNADTLEAPHEKGIMHRDLKPGNIKLCPDGVVRALDLGLPTVGGATDVSMGTSATLSVAQTAGETKSGALSYF